MNFDPLPNQAVGRIVIKKAASAIVRVDESKITKFVLMDAVGFGFERYGLKAGDVVVVKAMGNLVMDGGVFRPLIDLENVALVVRGWASLDEFHVQTEGASQYVPFGDEKAAKSLGAPRVPQAAAPRPISAPDREMQSHP